MLTGHLPINLSQTLPPQPACSDEKLKVEKPRDTGATTGESEEDPTQECRLRTDALDVTGKGALIPL